MPRLRRGQRTPCSRSPARRPPRPWRRALPPLLAALLLAPGLAPVAQANALLDPLPERPSPPPMADDVWSYGALHPQGPREAYVQGGDRDDQGRSQEPDFASTQVFGGWTMNCAFQPDLQRAHCLTDSALPNPPAGHAAVLAPGCTNDQGRQPSGMCSLWTTGLGGPRHTVGVAGMTDSAAPGRFSHNKGTVVRFLDAQRLASIGLAQFEVNRKLDDYGINPALRGLDPNLGGEALLGPQSLFVWYGLWQDKNGNGVIDEESDLVHNEFTWVGSCGLGGPPVAHPCKTEWTQMLTWVWPNDYGAATRLLPPGLGALTFYGLPGPEGPASLPGFDPAIGGASPDFAVQDFTGAAEVARRGWFATPGLPALFTDDSLFSTSVVATATFPEGWAPGLPAQGAARDVDLYRSMSPVVSDLYASLLRPNVPLGWALLRDTATQAEATAAETFATTPETAEAWDIVQDTRALVQGGEVLPHLWHEPNTPRDAYPGAVWDPVAPAWDGAGNTYPSSMLWADNHALPLVPVPLTGLYEGSVYLGTDVVPTTSLEGPRQRQAPPGLLGFVARAGKWTDLNGDTWVGQADLRVGLGDDLNDYADTQEWQGRCAQTAVARRLAVEPAGMLQGQRWPPAFLVKDYDGLLAAPDASWAVPWELVPLEGLEGPVTLRFRQACDDLSTVRSRDALLLPTGALEFDLRVTATFPFQDGPSRPPFAEVRDVDVLAATASPPYSEPDGNGDGIGDYWEERWEYAVGTINTVGCADVYLDHDGLCLVQEFQWNTIPAYLPVLFQGWAPDYDRDDFGDKAESDYWTNWTGEQPLQTLRDTVFPAAVAQGQSTGGAWTATPVGVGRRVLSSVANSVVGDYAIAASQLTQSGSQALANCVGSGGCEADPEPCLASLGMLTVDGCIDAVDQATGYALRHPNYPVDLDGDGVFNIHDPDSDGDGLRDGIEYYAYGTYPEWPDSDCVLDEPPCRRSDGTGPTSAGAGDSLRDDAEVAYWEGLARLLGGRGWDVDLDEDGVPSNLLDPDSDGDGLLDGEEVNGVYSPPAGLVRFPLAYRTDSDADELDDYAEVFEHGSDPLDPDTDDDAMPDGWEVRSGMSPRSAIGTDGRDSDNDQDGLLNLAEYCYRWAGESCAPWLHGTSGINPEALRADRNDTDGDKLCDGGGTAVCASLAEWAIGGEAGAGTNATAGDTDRGGASDGFEVKYGALLNPLDPADDRGDPDRDALVNMDEALLETDPSEWDTDGDEMPDGWERRYGLDPKDGADALGSPTSPADRDVDTLLNQEEYKYNLPGGWTVPSDGVWWNGTNPFRSDTDVDGLDDGKERLLGTHANMTDTDRDQLPDGFDPDPTHEFIHPVFDRFFAPTQDFAAKVRVLVTDQAGVAEVSAKSIHDVAGNAVPVVASVEPLGGGWYDVSPLQGTGLRAIEITARDVNNNSARLVVQPEAPGGADSAGTTAIVVDCYQGPSTNCELIAPIGGFGVGQIAEDMAVRIAVRIGAAAAASWVVWKAGEIVRSAVDVIVPREDQEGLARPTIGTVPEIRINEGVYDPVTDNGLGMKRIHADYPEMTVDDVRTFLEQAELVVPLAQGGFAYFWNGQLGGAECIVRIDVRQDPPWIGGGWLGHPPAEAAAAARWCDDMWDPADANQLTVAELVFAEWQLAIQQGLGALEYATEAPPGNEDEVVFLQLGLYDGKNAQQLPWTNFTLRVPASFIQVGRAASEGASPSIMMAVAVHGAVRKAKAQYEAGPWNGASWYWGEASYYGPPPHVRRYASLDIVPQTLEMKALEWSTGQDDLLLAFGNQLGPCPSGATAKDGEGKACFELLLKQAERLLRLRLSQTGARPDALLPTAVVFSSVNPAVVIELAEDLEEFRFG